MKGDNIAMTDARSTNVTWHRPLVARADREIRNGYKGFVLWLPVCLLLENPH